MLKRIKNSRLIIILCFFVISLWFFSSCSSLRKKKCDCPSWSYQYESDVLDKNKEEKQDNAIKLSSNS